MITDIHFWIVIALSVPIHWSLPRARRPIALAGISFAYLFGIDAPSVLGLLFFTLLYYHVAPTHRRSTAARRITSALAVLSLACLGFFKLLPALVARFEEARFFTSVVLPLGISYYSFKLVHYGIERGRGNLPEHNFWDFAAYLYLLPIFTAGPIERFDHFMANRSERYSSAHLNAGITRIAHGLIKKLVIIELLMLPLFGQVTDIQILFERLADLPAHKVWGFFVLSFLVAYLDFSAYSDIAIGISRLYGITIGENFNWPVLASNIGIFWQRWHMSLSNWCRAYVYMPLIGMTRNPYIAGYGTFLTMGLWHSVSPGWIMWGLWHATGTGIYTFWRRLRQRRKWRGLDRPGWRWLGIPITLAFTSCGGVFTLALAEGGVARTLDVCLRMIGVPLS